MSLSSGTSALAKKSALLLVRSLEPIPFPSASMDGLWPVGRIHNLQNTLRTGNHPSTTGIDFHCHPDCPCKCLECCLNNVMRVNPIELADVQRHLAMIHNRYEELPHQLSVVSSHPLGGNLQAVA